MAERAVDGFEGEAPLDPQHGTTLAAGPDGRRYVADVATGDRAVNREGKHVAGKHVDPSQATPTVGPDRSLAVVGDRVRHLLSTHPRNVPPDDTG